MTPYYNSNTMRLRVKLVLQAAALTFLAGFAVICVSHQSTTLRQLQAAEPEVAHPSWQERAPRSISSRDYDNILPLAVKYPSAPTISLSDVFISVKTTGAFHQSRLDVILKTWFTLAREETWFFTDTDDAEFQERTGGHMVNTNCSSSHNRRALCCKMSVEFDMFLLSDKKWFCHFDDDNYVNVPRLLRLLEPYSSTYDWYLGKPSIRAPLEILDREKSTDNPKRKISFWFATGGAGFCISRSLAHKMLPVASAGKFVSVGERIRLPDDVTMGYIIEHVLGRKLTVVEQFHSHLEPMKFLRRDTLTDQISFSHSGHGVEANTVTIDGFNTTADPTRFLSLHCYLFPHYSFCSR